ncbi:MAG TPA: nickel pincer cofactor biosynthesis protein LarC [Candidatus Hydrogenedentes bacterium]|nr:nickel pincer cofactor biosynthesis protein LarC [Candidatus Hydrogenedentota bacterium]HOS02903.1 nickel pincer cofactor biosynthesis protein LarC [Candidatus Hydrogenedentota bacterium]
MKAIYFDCYSGASGDMILGALIDAGADFQRLRQGLESLKVPGYTIAIEHVARKGVKACQFRVVIDETHVAPHRHLRHILEIIDAGDLPQEVKTAAARTFQRIAEVEAAIHDTTIEKVHFHEIGAIDSIVDVVGAHLALHDLGVDRVYASALHVGSGTVQCDHGLMPVPAPATAALLEGVPCYGGDVPGELVTPTGAALLAQMAKQFGPMPAMRIAKIGYGGGTRDLQDRPNVLRVLVGDLTEEADPRERIVVMEAMVDDMQPELFPPFIADVLAAGARDAFLTPVIGKKGRPAYVVTILCDEEKSSDITRSLFHGTTTIGVRMRTEHRVCLPRELRAVRTPWGAVRVKVTMLEGEIHTAAPEFEDCRARAEEAKAPVRRVYEAALAAALQGEFEHE